MRDELQSLLYSRYPNLYRQKSYLMSETAMCWGFEHRDGWFSIDDALCATLMNLALNMLNCRRRSAVDPNAESGGPLPGTVAKTGTGPRQGPAHPTSVTR